MAARCASPASWAPTAARLWRHHTERVHGGRSSRRSSVRRFSTPIPSGSRSSSFWRNTWDQPHSGNAFSAARSRDAHFPRRDLVLTPSREDCRSLRSDRDGDSPFVSSATWARMMPRPSVARHCKLLVDKVPAVRTGHNEEHQRRSDARSNPYGLTGDAASGGNRDCFRAVCRPRVPLRSARWRSCRP